MKIWEKHFFFETLKVLLFFLVVFWGLYVLIDYASHSGTFYHHTESVSFLQMIIFYTGELIRRSEVLLPFAILVGAVRVMTKLNTRNELVALLTSGLSFKRLLVPFVAIGLLGTLLLYLNEELLLPWAIENSRSFGEASPEKLRGEVQHLRLKDGSLLIFGSHQKADTNLHDVWWIPSINELWRFKTLSIEAIPKAAQGEYFSRNNEGTIVLKERFNDRLFPEIEYNPKKVLETLTSADELSLTDLVKKNLEPQKSVKQNTYKTQLYRKLLLPWLALFAILIPAPMATQISRRLNTFLIYVVSLFTLFLIYVVFNVGTIAAERELLSPFASLFIPFAIVFSTLGYLIYKKL